MACRSISVLLCRASSGAHSQHQVGVQRQAVGPLKGYLLPPPSPPHRAYHPISSFPVQPRATTAGSVLSCPGGTCQAPSSLWPWGEAGLSWDVCVFADAFSSPCLFPFLRRIHPGVAAPQGLFPPTLLSLVQGGCSTAARSRAPAWQHCEDAVILTLSK